ncbi:methyltransferase family protein [Bacteroidota bacterium]
MTTLAESIEKEKKLTTKAKIYIARGVFASILFTVYFFVASGKWDYDRAWISYIYFLVIVLSSNLYLAKKNPELLDQRSKIQKGSKKWDVWWLVFFGLFFLHGAHIIAGLDLRYNDPSFTSTWYWLFGAIFYLAFSTFTTWAMAVNKHFESSVRIQDDREHNVVSSGPYKYVRHPGYTGIFGWAIGFSLQIGSLWALYAGIITLIAVIIRTYFEDKTLQNELDGYKEYTEKVRFRLIPGVW